MCPSRIIKPMMAQQLATRTLLISILTIFASACSLAPSPPTHVVTLNCSSFWTSLQDSVIDLAFPREVRVDKRSDFDFEFEITAGVPTVRHQRVVRCTAQEADRMMNLLKDQICQLGRRCGANLDHVEIADTFPLSRFKIQYSQAAHHGTVTGTLQPDPGAVGGAKSPQYTIAVAATESDQ